jgi:hypothetical protein
LVAEVPLLLGPNLALRNFGFAISVTVFESPPSPYSLEHYSPAGGVLAQVEVVQFGDVEDLLEEQRKR